MLYESRIYYTVPGRLPALNARFANHTMGFFRRHGIGMLGFWTDEIGVSNRPPSRPIPSGNRCGRRPRPTVPSWRRW